MTDLRELYQQVILDHNKNPRNFREITNASSRVEGYNPLCGDHYTVFLQVDGDTIKLHGEGEIERRRDASVRDISQTRHW